MKAIAEYFKVRNLTSLVFSGAPCPSHTLTFTCVLMCFPAPSSSLSSFQPPPLLHVPVAITFHHKDSGSVQVYIAIVYSCMCDYVCSSMFSPHSLFFPLSPSLPPTLPIPTPPSLSLSHYLLLSLLPFLSPPSSLHPPSWSPLRPQSRLVSSPPSNEMTFSISSTSVVKHACHVGVVAIGRG